ncbi:NTP transferase domain-containing protein [Gammaproteobacteria bacterium]|nr:NTP transferase domain-containing protein [Gammaproteobacteria bacterium]
MQILIPMTGNGSRFASQGYKRLKPFIKIHGYPMIHWVVKMFPGDEDKITFICRDEHLKDKRYVRKELKNCSPNAQIYEVEDWKKLGPVSDVLRASEIINNDESVLVSYCDFFVGWNYKEFKGLIKKYNPHGAVPCYTGFHPHLIHKENIYANCEIKKDFELKKIREKHQLHKNKYLDLQSPGLYYFQSGRILKDYCKKLINSKNSINGEYYMSLPFNDMVKDNLSVLCPPIVEYFCQWGTPKDLEEYNYWMNIIDKVNK